MCISLHCTCKASKRQANGFLIFDHKLDLEYNYVSIWLTLAQLGSAWLSLTQLASAQLRATQLAKHYLSKGFSMMNLTKSAYNHESYSNSVAKSKTGLFKTEH